ncbi:MAG: STAS domain-containing protein [Phycisphaerales bacterium]|nr:STAS domain-containing protein [Phycisphaerales bacterium]
MAAQYVDFEHSGLAIIARLVPSKVTEREAAVIRDEIVAAGPAAAWRVAVDLSDVTLLASAGLGALLTINKSCRAGGGQLAIFGLGEDILGMMKIARLDKVLQIKPDRESALKVFK